MARVGRMAMRRQRGSHLAGRWGLLAWAVLLTAGCAERPATQVLVHFDADPGVMSRGVELRVRVFALGEALASYDETRRLITPDAAASFPATLPVVPLGGDAARRFRVLGEVSDAEGVVFAMVSGEFGFEPYTLDEVRLRFEDGQLLVRFEADPRVTARALDDRSVRLRVRVFDRGAVAARYDEPDAEAVFPTRRAIFPAQDPAPPVRVLGELSDASGVFASVSAELDFVPDALREVVLRFEDACVPMIGCEALGLTCRRGECVSPCVAPAAEPGTGPTPTVACAETFDCDCPCADDRCEGGRCIPAARARQVSAGVGHTCAVDTDGRLSCWGSNHEGQLGLGGGVGGSVGLPTRLSFECDAIDSSGDCLEGDPLGAVLEVHAGDGFTCALRPDGARYCWGNNRRRNLGSGSCCGDPLDDPNRPRLIEETQTFTTLTVGLRHGCGVRRDASGRLACWGDNRDRQNAETEREQYSSPRDIDFATDWSSVDAGYAHTCGIRSRSLGELYCWGNPGQGRLGTERGSLDAGADIVRVPFDTGARSVSAGGLHTCVVLVDETLHCFGRGTEGQLGDGARSDRVASAQVGTEQDYVSVSAGQSHTCSIRYGGLLECFGSNLAGELGVGNRMPSLAVPTEIGLGYASVSAGRDYTCAITADGKLYCWGANGSGQLGTGDTRERSRPTRICLPDV